MNELYQENQENQVMINEDGPQYDDFQNQNIMSYT
jgi:hypothetical protein